VEVGLFFVPKTKDKKRFVAVNKEMLQRQKRESAGDKRHSGGGSRARKNHIGMHRM